MRDFFLTMWDGLKIAAKGAPSICLAILIALLFFMWARTNMGVAIVFMFLGIFIAALCIAGLAVVMWEAR